MKKIFPVFCAALMMMTSSCDDKEKIDEPTVCFFSTTLLSSIHMPQEHERPFGVRFAYDTDCRLEYAYEYQLTNNSSASDTLYGWKYVFDKMKDNVINVKRYYRANNAENVWSESSTSRKLYYTDGQITKVMEYYDGGVDAKNIIELEWQNGKIVKRTTNGVVYGDDLISYKNGNFVDFDTKTGSTSVNDDFYQKRTIDTKSTFGKNRGYLRMIPIEYIMGQDAHDYKFPLHLYFSDNALEKQVYSIYYENFEGDRVTYLSTKMQTTTSDYAIEYSADNPNYPNRVIRNDTEKNVVVDYKDESNNSELEKETTKYTIEFQYEVRN